MRGFTLWEPWASLMAHGYKKNETRSWHTKYRGPLAIHAAKTKKCILDSRRLLTKAGIIHSLTALVPEGFPNQDPEWPLGKIVAIVDLIDCIPTEEAEKNGLTRREKACGDYSPGRFAWITNNLRRVDLPIPWKGMQGLWRVPEDLATRLI